jgi:hypothetical protein
VQPNDHVCQDRAYGPCPRPECGRPENPLLINRPLFSDGTPAPIDFMNGEEPSADTTMFERDDLGREIIPDTLFVIVWDDASITTANNRAISNMYDMADCDYMDGVKSVHAVDENGELVKVGIGPSERTHVDPGDECPFVYASAPIMAGKRRVGTVNLTDH